MSEEKWLTEAKSTAKIQAEMFLNDHPILGSHSTRKYRRVRFI